MKESCKACEESGKACEESCKAYGESEKACEKGKKVPCKNTSKPPVWKRIFWKKIFTGHGAALTCVGPIEGPSGKWFCMVCTCVVCGMVCAGLHVLFLSMEEGRSIFGVMERFWAKF